MYKANCKKHLLKFKQPGGTSRGILTEKETWFIEITDNHQPAFTGIGECNLFNGLSADDSPDFEKKINDVCRNINDIVPHFHQLLASFPSIRSGLEQALIHLENRAKHIYFPSLFTGGKEKIRINGLVWMGDIDFMKKQADEKIKNGFSCIKIKIGSLPVQQELDVLEYIRKKSPGIEIRLDANGAFTPENALEKLKLYAPFKIHSVEQPIQKNQRGEMKKICQECPIPIALDEELIGIHSIREKEELLEMINPQYLILKPGLLGGFKSCEEWITLAGKKNIHWWATSALESNIGLNAIAQWAFTLNNHLPQGLGTGSLFTNNFESPLRLKGEYLYFSPAENGNE